MANTCSKCGKKAIVNDTGRCFDCANVGGIKYTSKKKVMPYGTALAIWVVAGILDVVVSFLILQCTKVNLLGSLFYGIVHLFFIVSVCGEKAYYGCSTAPVLDLIVKVALVVNVPESLKNHQLQLGSVLGDLVSNWLRLIDWKNASSVFWSGLYFFIIRPVVVVVVLMVLFSVMMWIAHILGCRFENKKLMDLNEVLCKEEKLQNLEEVSDYRPLYSEAGRKEIEEKYLDYAIETVMGSDASAHVKEQVIAMLQSQENEVEATNDVMLAYYDTVEACMLSEIPQDEKGNWIDEIGQDMSCLELPLQFPKVVCKEYVTRKLFEIGEKISKDIKVPWNSLKGRYNTLNPAEWLHSFKGDKIVLDLGERGEMRVARELAPYDDQMIVLPNIRLVVEGESIESDFVVISSWGIYVLEVKNLGSGGSFDLLIEKDGRWSKVRGGYQEVVSSPVHQNERHIVYMEKLLNKELGRGIDSRIMIQGMVVLANDRVTINNHSDNLIKRYDNIINTIRGGERVLKEADMKQIAEILQKSAVPVKTYPSRNYFKLFLETRILKDEYKHWKSSTRKLVQIAKTYGKEIL